jgi:hypothetical protein
MPQSYKVFVGEADASLTPNTSFRGVMPVVSAAAGLAWTATAVVSTELAKWTNVFPLVLVRNTTTSATVTAMVFAYEPTSAVWAYAALTAW